MPLIMGGGVANSTTKHTHINKLGTKCRQPVQPLLGLYSNAVGNKRIYPPLCILCEVLVHEPYFYHLPCGGEDKDSHYLVSLPSDSCF